MKVYELRAVLEEMPADAAAFVQLPNGEHGPVDEVWAMDDQVWLVPSPPHPEA